MFFSQLAQLFQEEEKKSPRSFLTIQKFRLFKIEGAYDIYKCGGSMVVRLQTVKLAVPGSNPASLQPAGTCHSLLGSQQGWYESAGLPLRAEAKNTKIPTKK